jgi:glycosyltransferase involved in cell wall biosynthesis
MTMPHPANENNPLVSVLVACYNQSRYVKECLDSVCAQTYRNVELIIIDDRSQDDSVAVIQEWLCANNVPAKFVAHAENQGICKTFNDALFRSTGKYISLLAADDVYLTNKIEHQVEMFERLPAEVGVVYGDAWQMDESGNRLEEKFVNAHRRFETMPEGNIFHILLSRNFIPAAAAMIRRECFEALGPYDEALVYEDFDMWLRIARHYQFAFSPYIDVKYRIVPGSITRALLRKGTGAYESDFRIYEKWIHSNELSLRERQQIRARLAAIAFHMYRDKCPGRNRYLGKAFRYHSGKYLLAMLLSASFRRALKYFTGWPPRPISATKQS